MAARSDMVGSTRLVDLRQRFKRMRTTDFTIEELVQVLKLFGVPVETIHTMKEDEVESIERLLGPWLKVKK